MTREEMLAKLHAIDDVRVDLTALTAEEVLDCRYFTSEGFSSEWIGINDWPILLLIGLKKDFLEEVGEKAANDELTFEDLEDTVLEGVFHRMCSQCDTDDVQLLNRFFSGLGDLKDYDSELFVLNEEDTFSPSVSYFTDYESLKEAYTSLRSQYTVDSTWDSFDDDELEGFIEEVEAIDALPICTCRVS